MALTQADFDFWSRSVLEKLVSTVKPLVDRLQTENEHLRDRVKALEEDRRLTQDTRERLIAIEVAQKYVQPGVELKQVEEIIEKAITTAFDSPLPVEVSVSNNAETDREYIQRAVDEAVAKIEVPQPRDGKDADPEVIKALVEDAVDGLREGARQMVAEAFAPVKGWAAEAAAEAVAAIPLPPVKKELEDHLGNFTKEFDGLRERVDLRLENLMLSKNIDMDVVKDLIDANIAKIPAIQPDPEQIKRMVNEAVSQIEIPQPKDGKDADPELIKSLVAEAVAQIEVRDGSDGRDGKDADPEVIKALVAEAVAQIEVPQPRDGKDADPALIKQLVDEAVSKVEVRDGRDGKDADPDEVKRLVEEAVLRIEIPTPRDGKDADPAEVKRLVDEAVAKIEVPEVDPAEVKRMVDDAVAGIEVPEVDPAQIKRMVDEAVGKIEVRHGKDADPEQVKALVAEAVARIEVPEVDPAQIKSLVDEAVGRIEIPIPRDGKDADPDEVKRLVEEAVLRIEIPTPRDGKDADPAVIKSLVDGAVASIEIPQPKEVDPAQIKSLVDEAVAKIEVRDGKDADPEVVKSLINEAIADIDVTSAIEDAKHDLSARLSMVESKMWERIEHVKQVKARDGIGVASTRINDDGELILKLTNGDTFNLGVVKGRDGFGLKDFDVEYDGERKVTLKFSAGDMEKSFDLTIPALIDRGVWAHGTRYEKGDVVSWGGSMWIAKEATEKQPNASPDWRLSVKRGRDAKEPVKVRDGSPSND
jgi:hypothetical protein